MPDPIAGLHHVTAIAGAPQETLDFYAGTLGLRFVKRTVNFDDPTTYHFYFGDAEGRPGTILTFFPWKGAPRGRHGPGQAVATAFAVPPNAIERWQERLRTHGVAAARLQDRFGAAVLAFTDPHGTLIELVGDDAAPTAEGWAGGSVAATDAIRSLHSVTCALHDPAPTAALVTEVFGYERVGQEGQRHRYASPSGARASTIDLLVQPDKAPGTIGAGTVHHIAVRVPDDAAQQALRETLLDRGLEVTEVKDRQYFRSIYFRPPGGVLFEIATDGPGFATDEPLDALGETLKLPPWLEERRAELAKKLPSITIPTAEASR